MKSLNAKNDIQTSYNEFRNVNIEKLENIEKKIIESLRKLEGKYSNFEDIYQNIENNINLLSTILSNFTDRRSREYVKKLGSIIKSYRKWYSPAGIDFNNIYNLTEKISRLNNDIFKMSVEKIHGLPKRKIRKDKVIKRKIQYDKKSYKWITFERNNSWFITSFRDIQIIENGTTETSQPHHSEDYDLRIGKEELIEVKDLFSSSRKSMVIPKHYISINKGEKVFAASQIGTIINAKNNFITSVVKPYKKLKSKLSPGIVRILGRNYILLD
ncbi:hypothetical protein ACFL20_09975 [Spirochaetota bacterium]